MSCSARAHGVGRGVFRAGHQAVDIADRQHHRAQDDGILNAGDGLLRRQPLGFAQFDHPETRSWCGFRPDRRFPALPAGWWCLAAWPHSRWLRACPLGCNGQCLFRADGGGAHGTRFFAFGQDNALAGGTGFLDELITEGRWRELGVFRNAERRRDGVSVEMFGRVQDGFHALAVVSGNGAGFNDARAGRY